MPSIVMDYANRSGHAKNRPFRHAPVVRTTFVRKQQALVALGVI